MLTDFHITLQAQRPIQWPHFAGSRIRGAWGHALRQAACITGQRNCEGCAMRTHCAYGAMFDPAAPAQPLHPSFQNGIPGYVIQIPPLGARQLQPGDTVRFTLRLFAGGQADHKLAEHVLRDAVNQRLFKPGDCALQSIERQNLPVTDTTPNMDGPALSSIHIQWLTPIRLQHQGKPLFRPQDLSATILASAAWRRYLQWCQLTRETPSRTLPPLDAARACTLDTAGLQWHDISRYSNTQQTHLPLGGLLGHAILSGPDNALKTLLPTLRLGELLHIGKETVFGLGRYQLQPLA